jgi:hypothetical protein
MLITYYSLGLLYELEKVVVLLLKKWLVYTIKN